MKPPIDPPRPAEDGRSQSKRPGGHGSYKLGGEPAVGHRWHEAPPPPPAKLTPFDDVDDGVPHRHHEPGEEDPLHNDGVEHEHRDINIKAVIACSVIMAIVVGLSQVAMWGLFEFFESQAKANEPVVSPLARPNAEMPKTTMESPFFNSSVGGPQLMVNEPMNLANLRASDEKRLRGYGWVNQGGGIAYMPIEQAKKLIRERGLPVREGEAAAPTLGTRAPSRGESSGGRMMVIGGDVATAPAEPAAPAAPAPPEKPAGDTPTAKPHGPGGH